MATSPNSLMDQAVCIDCNIPAGMQMAVLIGLMDQIATNGTGGGGGGGVNSAQGFSGNYAGGVPTAVPTSATSIAVDTSNNGVWIWFGSAWHNTGLSTA